MSAPEMDPVADRSRCPIATRCPIRRWSIAEACRAIELLHDLVAATYQAHQTELANGMHASSTQVDSLEPLDDLDPAGDDDDIPW